MVDAVQSTFPADRVGVRFSPNGQFGGMGSEDNYDTFIYVMEELSTKGLGYLAIIDGTAFGTHDKDRLLTAKDAKTAFKGTVMANCGYTKDTAEEVLQSGNADFVSFGRPYLSTPDLVERFQNDWPLNPDAEFSTFYENSLGAKGYTDYPTYQQL